MNDQQQDSPQQPTSTNETKYDYTYKTSDPVRQPEPTTVELEQSEQNQQYTQQQPKPSFLRKLGPIGFLLIFLSGKLKYLWVILQVGKFKTFISMLISVWAYALFWGWPFAAGFVVLIFVHEMGHVFALRLMGIKATAPMFIPFVGAYISMKDMPKNAFVEAFVALGGPLLGTVGAIGCAGAGLMTDNPFWYALASSGFLINLFNLLPISPLDGGRIIGAISPKLWILGLLGALLLVYLTWSPVIILIVIMGSYQIYKTSKMPTEMKSHYYQIPMRWRVIMGSAFLALLAITSIGMMAMQIPLEAFQDEAGISAYNLFTGGSTSS